MKALLTLLAVAVVLVGSALSGSAAVPQLVSYQGRLTDSFGAPVDTTVAMTFHIYNDSGGTIELWVEFQPSVVVQDGLFTVLLGAEETLGDSVFTGLVRYLGMQVGNGPVGRPLIPIGSVAYAYRALTADTAKYVQNAGGDVHWTLTDGVLSTQGRWGLTRGTAGNLLYGDSAHTMVNLGTAGATGIPGQSYGFQTIAGGMWNKAGAWYATVGGGDENDAGANFSTIAGGQRNKLWSMYGAVSGGFADTAQGFYSAALSGRRNVAGTSSLDTAAFVGGGSDNRAQGMFATIGGGRDNKTMSSWAAVGGGWQNEASGGFSSIAGGARNAAREGGATVGGGSDNIAAFGWATIPGGQMNQAHGVYATIGGGLGNLIDGYASTIPGGCWDTVMATHSYLFGIRSRLTHDSTFMVDLPHIRFGDETDGYEFPTADGDAGQVMTTDGNGRMSWGPTPPGGWVNDGTRVRLGTATDSVGIGVTAPAAPLHVFGNTYGRCLIEGSSAFASLDLKISGGTTAELRKYFDGGVELATNSPSYLDLHTEEGGRVMLRVGDMHRITMDSSGRVSIGALGPKNQLDVGGATVIGRHMAGLDPGPVNGLAVEGYVGLGVINPNRRLYVADSVPGLAYALKLDNPRSTVGTDAVGMLFSVGGDGGNGYEVNRGKGALVYSLEGTYNRGSFHFLQDPDDDLAICSLADAVMTIKNNGNVGVGTTNPNDKLEVEGFIRMDGGAGGGSALRFVDGGTLRWALLYRPWASHKLGFFDEQAGRWTLAMEQGSGEVGIGTDSPNYTLDVRGTIGNNATLYHSDRRWKKNVVALDHALDKVLRLRGVNYEWRTDEFAEMRFPTGRQVGLIAQEVEGEIPEIVSTDADGYKSVDYAKLTAVLVEAVKELQKQNETLQKRIEALEGRGRTAAVTGESAAR
ncbi:MAG TPA: tail fiber domain-containing protein [candidate division Zixibacteria bacterium]|nr:tail fiber domain-containing protein [candidate division Zixibacteria bacterium]